MDNGRLTTRKRFLRRAGLALAGVGGLLSLGKATRKPTPAAGSKTAPGLSPSTSALAERRLKPASGTVRYRA